MIIGFTKYSLPIFSFTLNVAIDFLMDSDVSDDCSSDENDDNEVIMLPLIEKANAESDMDSGASDDMNEGLVHHLPRRLLNSTCESNLLKDYPGNESPRASTETASTTSEPVSKKQKKQKKRCKKMEKEGCLETNNCPV